MWIVMTRTAKMPGTVRHLYRNVAVVQIDAEHAATGREPKMISYRAKGVLAIRHFGHHHVGKTDRGAWQKAMVEAQQLAANLNARGE